MGFIYTNISVFGHQVARVHPRMSNLIVSNPIMSNKMQECPKMSNALINYHLLKGSDLDRFQKLNPYV